jgi:hypothetical protein
LPEAWCNDDERCKKAAIPEDKRQFQSKTQLALAMLNPYLTHTINIHLKTICYVMKNLRVALRLEK